MNIRTIVAFSLFGAFFAGSASAMDLQAPKRSDDRLEAMRKMAANQVKTDIEFKKEFIDSVVNENRIVLTWKEQNFDKVSVKNGQARIKCIQDYLQAFTNIPDRNQQAKLLNIAKCGESLIKKALGNLKSKKDKELEDVAPQQYYLTNSDILPKEDEQENQNKVEEQNRNKQPKKPVAPKRQSSLKNILKKYALPVSIVGTVAGGSLWLFHKILKAKK